MFGFKTKKSRSIKVKDLLNDESGFYATPIILSILIILTTLSFTLFFLVQNDVHLVKRGVVGDKALATAESGIDNYLWHINQDGDYHLTQTHTAQGEDENGQKRWGQADEGRYHIDITAASTSGVTVECLGETTQTAIDAEVMLQRKVRVRIQKKSFTRYIYFTDNEKSLSGYTIWFITGDVIHGPLHSNDTININGNPVFEGKVTTHENINESGSSNPTFEEGYEEGAPALEIPSSNTDLINWSHASFGGYYYYGHTEIEFLSNGCLNVINSNPYSEGPTGTAVPLPSNGVIYVDGPQSPGTAPEKKGGSGWNTYNIAKWAESNGNAFVHGTLSGELTIGSSNNIYITGDITYNDADNDMLGLIANNWIYINHYDQLGNDVASNSINIKGAIFALNCSFGFEAFRDGPPKNILAVTGSIAQAYRGPVGTFYFGGSPASGYSKDYRYDERMIYEEPPHFLSPINAGFEIISWDEIVPK